MNRIMFPPGKYDFIRKLGVHYVPLVDVGVGTKYSSDFALRKGIEMDIFLRSPTNGERFKGKVWPGTSVIFHYIF